MLRMKLIAVGLISVLQTFTMSPAYAEGYDQPDELDDLDPASRGIPCRRTCEDRYKEWVQECDKMPEGFLRNGCRGRAATMHRMCLYFCPKDARDCLDEGGEDAMFFECVSPSQIES